MEGSAGDSARTAAATVADEALKKNTDCIYFLASPLTCKKGSECEYRHSEGARINPRDCWYWFNGSCLNPKCSFRHPPLDGLFGIPGPVSRSSEPPSRIIAISSVPPVHGPSALNTNKQNAPCYYFQNGYCSKGERCPFVHKLQTENNSVLQHTAGISAVQSETSSKVITNKSNMHHPEVVAEQNVSKGNKQYVYKAKEILSSGNLAIGHQTVHNNDSVAVQASSAYASLELPVFGLKKIPHTPSQSLLPQSRLVKRQNGKEAENFYRESSSSPVNNVDLHMEDSDYLQNEENYFETRAQCGIRSSVIDYDKQQSDHNTVQHFESNRHQEMRNQGRYEPRHEHYGRERIKSSVRTLDRPMPETRSLAHEERYEKTHNLDLRHQLLKHKRSNGLRPNGSYVQGVEDSTDERYPTRHPYQNRRDFPKDGSVSNRLHGRIGVPSKLPPNRPIDLRSQLDREVTGIRRKSPRPISSQLRHHERIKKRSSEDPRTNNISGRLSLVRDRDSLEFAPKSLADLKCSKVSDSFEYHGSLKSGGVLNHCKLKSSLSFEGPKPLSVLKRKRNISPIKVSSFTNVDNKGDIGEPSIHATAVTLIGQPKQSSVSQHDQSTRCSPEASRVVSEDEEGLIAEDGDKLFNDGQFSAKGDAVGSEEGMIMDDSDDQEFENYGDGSREYGRGDTEDADYKVEEDENVSQDDEDDDEDDFAKKVGFMLS